MSYFTPKISATIWGRTVFAPCPMSVAPVNTVIPDSVSTLMLAAECGSELVLTVEGPDEEEAADAVAKFLETESE